MIAWEQWKGPVVLILSGGHGIHLGDLPAIPLVALAIALWRRRVPADGHAESSPSLAFPASAIVLGLLLLLAGVVAKAGGGSLVPSGGGTLDGAIEQASGTDPVPVERWSDVAVTYDGAALRLYVDGTEVSSRAVSGTIQTTRNPLWIGGNQPYGEHFHGVIDEVRVYARALGPEEIREDMTEARRAGPRAGGGIFVRRRFRRQRAGLLGGGQYGRHPRRHVDAGTVRRRAELRRRASGGHGPSLGLLEPHEGDDALGMGPPGRAAEQGGGRSSSERPTRTS